MSKKAGDDHVIEPFGLQRLVVDGRLRGQDGEFEYAREFIGADRSC